MRASARAWGAAIVTGSYSRAFSGLAREELSCCDFQQLRQSLNSKNEECLELVKEWVSQGNQLTQEWSSEIFQSLVDRKLNKEALKVGEYMKLMGYLNPSPELCATQLKLTSREHGSRATENCFTRLPAAMKTEHVMATFLTCLVKQRAPFKGLMYMNDFKFKTPELCGAMLSIYWALNMHEKMLDTYTKCREQGTALTIPGYLLMLRYKKRLGGLKGIEEQARVALDNSDDHLFTPGIVMEVQAHLGQADKVEELWRAVEAPRHDNFVSALTSFQLLGRADRAEEVFKEFLKLRERSNLNPYFKMIDVYSKLGMMYEAELMLDQFVDAEDRCFYPFNSLIEAYLVKGDVEKALQKLQRAYSERTVSPSYEVVVKLLALYAEEKDLTGANKLLHFYMNKYRGDVLVYNNYLRVLVATRVKPGEILKKFRVEPNEETRQLLRRVNWAGDFEVRKSMLESVKLW